MGDGGWTNAGSITKYHHQGIVLSISNSPSVSKTHGSFPEEWIGFIGDSHLMDHA